MIRTAEITPEILGKNRLIITVNEKINALEEVVVTPENTESFSTSRKRSLNHMITTKINLQN